jgi:hypothetical protein
MANLQLATGFMRVACAATVALALGGCVGQMPGSVSGGECKVFHDPGFAVRGKRLVDNQWIGKTQETGIDVCGWKRPQK